jgi:hypothetical protein
MKRAQIILHDARRIPCCSEAPPDSMEGCLPQPARTASESVLKRWRREGIAAG